MKIRCKDAIIIEMRCKDDIIIEIWCKDDIIIEMMSKTNMNIWNKVVQLYTKREDTYIM